MQIYKLVIYYGWIEMEKSPDLQAHKIHVQLKHSVTANFKAFVGYCQYCRYCHGVRLLGELKKKKAADLCVCCMCFDKKKKK